MVVNLALITSLISVFITIANFYFGRKEKAIRDKGEVDEDKSDQKLIDYRLTKVEEKLDKILDILDSYDKEIDLRVDKAIERHVELYHKKREDV